MQLSQVNAQPPNAEKTEEFDFWFNRWFVETVPQSEVRWVICIAGAVMLLAVAFYVVNLIRSMGSLESSGAGDLVEFQDLYERGAFSDEEIAKVKKNIRSNCDDSESQELTFEEDKPDDASPNESF